MAEGSAIRSQGRVVAQLGIILTFLALNWMSAVFYPAAHSIGVGELTSARSHPPSPNATADLVVRGTVVKVASQLIDGTIRSTAEVSVHLVERGQHVSKVIVQYEGGEVGQIGLALSTQPRFTPSEHVLLYLARGQNDSFTVVGGPAGKILLDSSGQALQQPAGSGYSYSGMHWSAGNIPVGYYVNTASGPAGALDAVQAGFQTWSNVGTAFSFQYMGTTTSQHGSDGLNVVCWQPYDGPGDTLAVATIWYVPSSNEIVECDIQFDTSESWTTDGSSDKFDVQNIAAHESGHWLCLNDLYDPAYSEMTMYGYAGLGETKKRTLEWGDVAGINLIYGTGVITLFTTTTTTVGTGLTTSRTTTTFTTAYETTASTLTTSQTLTTRQTTDTTASTETTTSTSSSTSHSLRSTTITIPATTRTTRTTTLTTATSTQHVGTTVTPIASPSSTQRTTHTRTDTQLLRTTATEWITSAIGTRVYTTPTTLLVGATTTTTSSGNTVWIVLRRTESLLRIVVTAYTESLHGVVSDVHIEQHSKIITILDTVVQVLREITEVLMQIVYFNLVRLQVYDTIVRQPVRVVVPQMYGATEKLGFILTGNIYDDSAVGFAYAHRSGAKILFTKTDMSRTDIIGAPTWLDYAHLVTFGGRLASPTVAYYEDSELAPLRWDGNATHDIIRRGAEIMLAVPHHVINASNDYFVMEVLEDGAHKVFMLWGITQWGTYASGVYFDGVYSAVPSMTAAWYIVLWQDKNGDGLPGFPSEFTTVASGS